MSTATLTRVTEARGTAVAAAAGTGRILVRIIDPGMGSSGYYSTEVLQRAATDRVFARGTQMYLDHPTAMEEAEEQERPGRSIRDMAAVLVEDARWDAERGALVAEARLFGPWAQPIKDMAGAEAIGVSIRATAEAHTGDVDGQTVTVIDRLIEAWSIDFVNRAGRGGRIEQVLESAAGPRPVAEARNIGTWVEAQIHRSFTNVADGMFGDGRLTREERIALSSAIGDALAAFVATLEERAPQLYSRDLWTDPATAGAGQTVTAEATRPAREALPGGHTADALRAALADAVKDAHGSKTTWTYVHDFTDTAVYFRVDTEDSGGLYQQAYTAADSGAVTLTGTRTEVRAEIRYVPVTAAGDGTTPTSTSEGASPPMAEIPDTELAQLREAAARADSLQTQIDELGGNATRAQEAERRAAEATAESHRLRAVIAARPAIDAALAESGLPAPSWPRVTTVVMGVEGRAIPLTEAGDVDTEALSRSIAAAVEAERAYIGALAEAAGVGIPRGLGGTGDTGTDPADTERALAEGFRRIGLSETAAAAAAKGR